MSADILQLIAYQNTVLAQMREFSHTSCFYRQWSMALKLNDQTGTLEIDVLSDPDYHVQKIPLFASKDNQLMMRINTIDEDILIQAPDAVKTKLIVCEGTEYDSHNKYKVQLISTYATTVETMFADIAKIIDSYVDTYSSLNRGFDSWDKEFNLIYPSLSAQATKERLFVKLVKAQAYKSSNLLSTIVSSCTITHNASYIAHGTINGILEIPNLLSESFNNLDIKYIFNTSNFRSPEPIDKATIKNDRYGLEVGGGYGNMQMTPIPTHDMISLLEISDEAVISHILNTY